MKRVLFLLLFVSLTAQGADKVKIGFISTLSGPNASIGSDIRDAFNLAVKLNGGKLGGLPAEVLVSDDQLKPENAKQIAERYLQKDKVDFITGIVFSNVVMAVAPDAISARCSSSRPTPARRRLPARSAIPSSSPLRGRARLTAKPAAST